MSSLEQTQRTPWYRATSAIWPIAVACVALAVLYGKDKTRLEALEKEVDNLAQEIVNRALQARTESVERRGELRQELVSEDTRLWSQLNALQKDIDSKLSHIEDIVSELRDTTIRTDQSMQFLMRQFGSSPAKPRPPTTGVDTESLYRAGSPLVLGSSPFDSVRTIN